VGKRGHIRPFCFKLHGYPNQSKHKLSESEVRNVKKDWLSKSNNVGLMVHTSQRVSSSEDWYFDNGCSKHMTRVNRLSKDVRSCDNSYVTFGDGGKGKIMGIGSLVSDELPKLENVFFC
jgi:hypothetical protein